MQSQPAGLLSYQTSLVTPPHIDRSSGTPLMLPVCMAGRAFTSPSSAPHPSAPLQQLPPGVLPHYCFPIRTIGEIEVQMLLGDTLSSTVQVQLTKAPTTECPWTTGWADASSA